MTVCLIIISALVAVGLPLYLLHKRDEAKAEAGAGKPQPLPSQSDGNAGCCGMHITCERDSLLPSVSEKIDYYDDEELDRFIGRDENDYTDEEIEEFRDVLLTLLPDDIAGWGRSIQLRGINLPTPIREELMMIVSEERSRRKSQ